MPVRTTDYNNEDRTASGRHAFDAFVLRMGDTGEPSTNLADLLADLMHYAHSQNLNFEYCLDRARDYYKYELDHPDE